MRVIRIRGLFYVLLTIIFVGSGGLWFYLEAGSDVELFSHIHAYVTGLVVMFVVFAMSKGVQKRYGGRSS